MIVAAIPLLLLAFTLTQLWPLPLPLTAGIVLFWGESRLRCHLPGPDVTVLLLGIAGDVALVWLYAAAFATFGLGSQRGIVRRGPAGGRWLALTFDDGPSPAWTVPILEVLRRHGVRATFFAVGRQVERHPDLARRIREEGHTLGSHGYSHRLLPLLSQADLEREIGRAARAVERATGERAAFFRPPWGTYDRRALQQVWRHHQDLALWTSSTQDWRNRGADRVIGRILDAARPGAVLLLHDADRSAGTSRQDTVDALDAAIPLLRQRGFNLVTLDEMLSIRS